MKNKLNHFLSKGIEPISLRHDFSIKKKFMPNLIFNFFAVPRAETIQASNIIDLTQGQSLNPIVSDNLQFIKMLWKFKAVLS